MPTLQEIFRNHALEFTELTNAPMVERSLTSSLEPLINDSLIKVIIGPRRAGKSTLAVSALKRFCLQHNKNITDILYLNFDDADLLKYSHTKILTEIKSITPKCEYVFFDEIQNLQEWELLVNTLHRNKIKCLITGSNANLLSKDLSTHLTGRHITIEEFPFSMSELEKSSSFDDYFARGGFPEIALKEKDSFRDKLYIENLIRDVIYKDIAIRHNIRNFQELERTVYVMINNIACALSMLGLKNLLGLKSDVTVKKYIQYLSDAYIVMPLSIYSTNYKVQVRNPKKFYLVDNGIYTFLNSNQTDNFGRRLENLVYQELFKNKTDRKKDIFYYKTNSGKEIDFLIKDKTRVSCLIQVCYELSGIDTQAREYSALVEAGIELKCDNLVVVTRKALESRQVMFNEKSITVVGVEEWIKRGEDFISYLSR